MDSKEKHDKYVKEETVQYAIRFLKKSGIPGNIESAAHAAGEFPVEYIKNAIVARLRVDGFDVNYNPKVTKEKRKKKIEELKKYIERNQ